LRHHIAPYKSTEWKNVLSPSSGSKSKPNKKSATSRHISLGLLFNPEDGSDMFLCNIRKLLSIYMTLQSRRSYSSAAKFNKNP
jgi:hypothetical protein